VIVTCVPVWWLWHLGGTPGRGSQNLGKPAMPNDFALPAYQSGNDDLRSGANGSTPALAGSTKQCRRWAPAPWPPSSTTAFGWLTYIWRAAKGILFIYSTLGTILLGAWPRLARVPAKATRIFYYLPVTRRLFSRYPCSEPDTVLLIPQKTLLDLGRAFLCLARVGSHSPATSRGQRVGGRRSAWH